MQLYFKMFLQVRENELLSILKLVDTYSLEEHVSFNFNLIVLGLIVQTVLRV